MKNRHLRLFELYSFMSGDWQCFYEGVLISPSLLSSPSSVSMFCAFSSSSSYRRLEMSCLISFSSPEEKQARWQKKKVLGDLCVLKTGCSSWNQFSSLSVSCLFYLQWSHHSLCLLGLWWCNAWSVASWSSASSDGKSSNSLKTYS